MGLLLIEPAHLLLLVWHLLWERVVRLKHRLLLLLLHETILLNARRLSLHRLLLLLHETVLLEARLLNRHACWLGIGGHGCLLVLY